MSRTTTTRRRMSLLASSSLAAASLMAGAGGIAVTLAPSVALAANECGDPSANAGAPDAFACTGVYATGIDYTTTTDGDLALILVDSTTVVDDGVRITGNAGENVSVTGITVIGNAGDVNITNTGGRGINLIASGGGSAAVDIQDTDAGDGTPSIVGSSDGIRVVVNGGGNATVDIDSGTVTGGTGHGIIAQANGGGNATVDFGSADVSGDGGIRAQAPQGVASVVGTGNVTSTTTQFGVFAGGSSGGSTVDISGVVTAGDVGVRAQATNGGTVNVTVGDINATGVGLSVEALSGGDANVLNTGAVSGSTGIVIAANAGGNVNVTTGGTVTGTAGNGITASSTFGNTTIDSTAGLVSSTDHGVAVSVVDGDGDITVGSVNGGFYGVVATAAGTGSMTVNVEGAVVGGLVADFDGIDIDTESGTATVNILAGGSVTRNGATAIGVDIDTWAGGSIVATVDGDILAGGLTTDVNSGAGTVNISGAGNISGGAFNAIDASTVDGDLTINVSGMVASGATGVDAEVSGAGNANVTVGMVTVAGTGVDVNVATGTATVTTNGVVNAGATGVLVTAGGNVNVNINADVFAGDAGVNASSTTGASTVTVAAGVTIDPDDYGIINVAATDSTVTTGDGVTILVDNSDADAVAIGVLAVSTAAADTGVGDPSVEVTLGTSNTVDLSASGFETDGGAAIWAANTGGGSGSVSVEAADGVNLWVQGDNAAAVYASTTSGDIDITLGMGTAWVYVGDGADSAGNLANSAGIYAASGSGNINIESNADVQAASTGGILGHGILAVTSGAGTVDITTGAGSYTWGSDYGIGVYSGDGDTTIVTGGMVQSDDLEAIFVNSGAGDISVTNNAAVTSGGAAAIELDAFGGDITVVSNAGVQGVGGIDADASGGSGFVDITVADGVTVNGTTGFGILATTDDGAVDIEVAGDVTAGGNGIWAVSTSGQINITTTGDVSGGTGGIVGISGGGVIVESSGGTITATGGSGISTNGLGTTVINSSAINATGGDGISAIASNTVTVQNSGVIAGTATNGITAVTTGTSSGAISFANSGQIGSGADGVSGIGINAAIMNAGASGNLNLSTNGSVYADTTGVQAVQAGTGELNLNIGTLAPVTIQGTSDAGVVAAITNGASTSFLTIDVGEDSTIIGGEAGLVALNLGTGATIVTLEDDVTIDPEDVGVLLVGAGEQTFVAGDGLSVDINNTDGDTIAAGIVAVSGLAADVALGDPAVDIEIGENLDLVVDDGAAGEADGSVGILAVTTGTASSEITVGGGAFVSITGDNAVGIGGISDEGNVFIAVSGGAIEVNAGDGADSAGNFPGSAGIAIISTGGNATIGNNATIDVDNGLLDASGIHAATEGAGIVTIVSNGAITSSDVGVNAESVDGAISIVQAGAITATNVGIQAAATGAGDINVSSTASITTTASDGIWALADTGSVTVTTSAGTTITAGDDGISALIVDAGATTDIVVDNNAAINANQSSGGGYGIYAWNSGMGDTSVDNSSTGTIGGSALYGIVAGTESGEVDVDNSGEIGSAGDAVATDGIYAYVNSGAGSVSVTNLATGVIWAEGRGIFAYAGGTGSVGVSNAAAIGGSASDGIYAEAVGGGVTVVNGGAIGSGADQVADSGIEAIVQSGASGILVQNLSGIWAAGTGIIADNNGTGQIIVTNSGALTTGAVGIYTDASGGGTQVTNSAAINALADGIQSNAIGAGGITVGNTGAIIAAADGVDTNAVDGATSITNSAAISAGDNGIEADASGTGAVTVSTTGAIGAVTDGIRAQSAGGAVTVTADATVAGGQDGIQTSTSGAAVTTVNVAANRTVSSAGVDAAGIVSSTTGTGLIDVNVANGATVAATNGSAIRTTSTGGAVTLDLGTGGAGAAATTIRGLGTGANSWVLDLNNAAGGTTTVNIASNTTVRSNDNTTAGYDDLAIRGVGGSVVVNNAGRLQGRVNFAGLTGNVVLNNSSSTSWHTTGASVFSGGADVLNNTSTGVIFTNAGGVATSWDFGAGADTFTQAGILVVGEPTLAASTLTITNLEAWNNSGSIFFGSSGTTASDGQINDRIDLASGTFTGSGNSRLYMDVNLGAVTQTGCAALTAADCFDATGASTAGSTTIRFNDVSGNAYGAFNPTGIVVVDVTGAGTTASGHFSLLSGQPFWRADANSADGVLDKGLFFYDLTLNGQQHLLVGLPDSEAFEFTTVGTAAQAAWYTTTGTWFDRQADLRQQLDESEQGAGLWMKITGSAADRDLENSYELFGVTYSFDTSYDQQTVGLVGGIDFVGASTADSSWLVGGMIGYVDSDVDFDASNTQASLEGAVYGIYGTYLKKNWFVDGVLAFNNLDLDYQAPTLAPAPNNVFTSEVNSWGFQVEGGYSVPLGTASFLEPIASLAYVNTEIDDIVVPGATIEYDDQTSLRGSIGARLGTNVSRDTFDAQFAITGRIWNEFEGENGLTIISAGPDLGLVDDFNGTFGEVSGTVNLFSNKAAFSAFVNAGVKFKDDYQSTDATLGFRWRW